MNLEMNYLSDTDENRLADLHWAFSSSEVDAIVCARGGYGCLRLADKIDYDLIKKNPKIFCGYSDISVLSSLFLKRANLITYSGPMARGDFGKEVLCEYTIENFFKTVERKEKLSYTSDKVYAGGRAEGIIFGGNLASIVSLCGTDFLPDDDFIFFAEDLNEPVYKIDKMFTQLFNMFDFRSKVKGIILGDFLDSGYPDQLDDLFYNFAQKYSIPILGGFRITHNSEKITVPVGAKAVICGDELVISEY